MANAHDVERENPWGTWEELLLAFAVNRHGTDSWESVAMEVQTRTTSSCRILTAHNCKQKYHDLERRFTAVDLKSNGSDHGSQIHDERAIPWLEELKKLRVEELRREVQRSDVSIVSLQQKVKKLKEEREQSSKEEDKSDPEKSSGEIGGGGGEKERKGEAEKLSPREDVEKRVSCDESDRENRSFNESNSTGPKAENGDLGTELDRKPDVPDGTDAGKPAPATVSGKSAGGEDSFGGSSDTAVKAAAVEFQDAVAAPEAGESGECRESVAESKESSDVQSSARLSRERRGRKAVSGNSSGEEAEGYEVSPVGKRISVKSRRIEWMVDFLEIIRSHKHGSVFERRLKSQEGVDYQNLIRQHMDLEMVKTKLEEGLYPNNSTYTSEFFRDLLLLFNNAIVFFPKNSTETYAAIQLRELVLKETARWRTKSKQNQDPQSPKQPAPPPPDPLPKPEPKPADSLPLKPNPSRPLVVCRKRSAISAKSHLPAPVQTKETKPVPTPVVKPGSDTKESNNSSAKLKKQRSKERSRGGRGNKSRTAGTGGNNGNSSKSSNANSNLGPTSNSGSKSGGLANEDSEAKTEKKNDNATAKKLSAANFLNRMKRSTGSRQANLLETLKDSVNSGSSSNNRGRLEQKKGGKGDGRREPEARQGSTRKAVQEQNNSAKKGIGRPPKRNAPPQRLPSPPRKKARVSADTASKASASRKRAKR